MNLESGCFDTIHIFKIPLEDLTTDLKKKPHKHIALGFCRKQQVEYRILLDFMLLIFVVLHDSGLQSIWTLLYVGRICAILSSYCSFNVLHGEIRVNLLFSLRFLIFQD